MPQVATHELTWDYTEGADAETAKYSLNGMNSYLSGAIGQVFNPITQLTEVWSAPASDGVIIRRNDGSEALPYRDISTDGTTPTAINDWNETALVPGPEDPDQIAPPSTIHNFNGVHLRVNGSGGLIMLANGLDHIIQVTPKASPLALTNPSGKERLVQWFLRNEQQSFGCGTNALDSWFNLSRLRFYYTEGPKQR
jgi:hypothetical protein